MRGPGPGPTDMRGTRAARAPHEISTFIDPNFALEMYILWQNLLQMPPALPPSLLTPLFLSQIHKQSHYSCTFTVTLDLIESIPNFTQYPLHQ